MHDNWQQNLKSRSASGWFPNIIVLGWSIILIALAWNIAPAQSTNASKSTRASFGAAISPMQPVDASQFVGSATCQLCHADHFKNSEQTPH